MKKIILVILILISLAACLPAEHPDATMECHDVGGGAGGNGVIICDIWSPRGIRCVALIDYDATAISCDWGPR